MEPSFDYQMIEARCAAAAVSTAPGGEVWARVDAINPPPPGCEKANAQWIVLHYHKNLTDPWATDVFGNPGGTLQRCADLLVPDAVGADLAACTPSPPKTRRDARSRTTLTCYDSIRSPLAATRRRPTRCVLKETADGFGGAYELRRIRWSNWGGPEARGTGLVRELQSGREVTPTKRRSFIARSLVRHGHARGYSSFVIPSIGENRAMVVATAPGPAH